MIYARVYESEKDYLNGFTHDYILDSIDDLCDLSWISSDDDVLIDRVIPFKISGTTYEEKKESLRNLAIDFQTSCQGGLSMGEMIMVESYFRENGKRYGLLEEFESECIC